MVEHRSPKPAVGGSSPSAPAREHHEPTDEADAGARRAAAEALGRRPPSAPARPPPAAPRQQEKKRKRTGARQFLKEVRQELKKVDWPNRRELISYTVVVLVTLVVTTAFVFGLDFVFSKAIFNLF